MGPPGSDGGGFFDGLLMLASFGLPFVFIVSVLFGLIARFFIASRRVYKFNFSTSLFISLLLITGSILNHDDGDLFGYLPVGIMFGVIWSIVSAGGVSLGIVTAKFVQYIIRTITRS